MAGSDIYTGSLELLILKSLTWGARHGYAVGQWIRQGTGNALVVQEGALYPALHRLERKGFVEEEWGITDTNREAKFYKLTPEGRKQLRGEVARWQAHVQLMTAALSAGKL
ncbi:MAG: PadR family transcriptional regulator [Gemmatimonadetes bacterium]|nr:PadR family transcriptional regulator [Gemmatimonadota bacterium]MCC6774735.1 PadR family transcriptional regulator [Gemmatimonadaceae bacterium]